VVLADLSVGMLAEARRRLAGRGIDAGQAAARVEQLPFADETFDGALASHVLYHVPDRAAALRDLRRVLRPGGRLLVATNEWTHLAEIRELVARFGLRSGLLPAGPDPSLFDLEAAAAEVSAAFGPVRVQRRRERLEVSDPEALVAYVRSMLPARGEAEGLGALREHVAGWIRGRGSFPVSVAAGVAEAVR
jgi:SAM-dependent methyltransferase